MRPLEIEAIERLDEPDHPDLDDVLERLAGIRVAVGDVVDERRQPPYQLLTRLLVVVQPVAPQQRTVVPGALCWGVVVFAGSSEGRSARASRPAPTPWNLVQVLSERNAACAGQARVGAESARTAATVVWMAADREVSPAMDPRPVTLTIADFCARTGVGRERLRTWERRHGFPRPVRQPGGPRRYDVDDVARVIAVDQALSSGISLAAAIRVALTSSLDKTRDLGAEDFLAEVDHAPLPMLALTGPDPLTVSGATASCAAARAPRARAGRCSIARPRCAAPTRSTSSAGSSRGPSKGPP